MEFIGYIKQRPWIRFDVTANYANLLISPLHTWKIQMGRSFIGLIICIGFASALKIGLTPREKYAIVKEHNRDRSKDASEGSDSASTMRKMVRFVKSNVWLGLWFMVFNATLNNISVISWRSVLLVEETGVPGENHRPRK